MTPSPRRPKAKPRIIVRGEATARDVAVARSVQWVAVAAVSCAAVAAILLKADEWFPSPPEKIIEVAWTHRCPCVHGWLHQLEDAGFEVRDHEIDDLSLARRRWHAPSSNRGCHPAHYLDYFIDGHATPELLSRLAKERPVADGLVQVSTGHEESRNGARDEVQFVLVANDGSSRRWP